MAGIEDFMVLLAYALTVLSAVLCVVYGIVNWNKPSTDDQKQIEEERVWEEHDPELSNEGADR